MNRTTALFAGLSLLLCVLASTLWAMGTHEDQSEDIFALGEVTVTASSMTAIEAGESVHTITAAEIAKTGARTVDEALVLLPDVNIKLGIDGRPRVEIRGAKSRDILVLMDGVPINSAFDGQFDPSSIPVDSIAKIKVTVGPSSVLYGSGAMGGVIDITTKRGGLGVKGSVGYEAGDGTPYLAKGSVSGATGKFDFYLNASAYHRDHFPVSQPFVSSIYEEAGYRKNSDDTRNNALMTVGFRPSDELRFSLSGNYVTGSYGKPASAINNAFDPYAPMAQFGRVDNYEGEWWQLNGEYNPSEALTVKSNVYYNQVDQSNTNYDDETYTTYNNPLIPGSYHLDNKAIKEGAAVEPSYDFGRAGLLTFKVTGEEDTWMDSGECKPGGGAWAPCGHGLGAGSPPYVLYPVRDHYVFYIYSAGLEYSVAVMKDLTFSAGLRQDWQSREDRSLEDYGFSASLRYDLFKDTALKTSFMRNIRFPTMSELYLLPGSDPTLREEKAFDYSLGMEQKLPWASLFEINGFYNNIYDFIGVKQQMLSAKEGYVQYNINFPHIRSYGFETSLDTHPVKELQLKLAYTFTESMDLSGPAFPDDREPLQYVPRDKATFTAKYDFPFGLTPFFSVIYVGDSIVYSKQLYVTVQRAYMTPYAVGNVKISQKLFRDTATVYVGVDNIMNRNYEDTYGIPRPGRYVYGGFEYRF